MEVPVHTTRVAISLVVVINTKFSVAGLFVAVYVLQLDVRRVLQTIYAVERDMYAQANREKS